MSKQEAVNSEKHAEFHRRLIADLKTAGDCQRKTIESLESLIATIELGVQNDLDIPEDVLLDIECSFSNIGVTIASLVESLAKSRKVQALKRENSKPTR